jgi:hypothetical protein
MSTERHPRGRSSASVSTDQLCNQKTYLWIHLEDLGSCVCQDQKVAAKFSDSNGHVSNANIIKMAQSDRYSVNYETVLESKATEDHLLWYNRKWFTQASVGDTIRWK